MSRRRISVKDLGVADCQGWLHRRKEGRSFLGSRWKKYWFVLKSCSLYWYTNRMAEKAEGFISLSGFTIEQARACRRKHVITASHPLVVTIFIAAESFTEMNKWFSKLSEAAELCEVMDAAECYSEGSDQDGDECVSQDSEQEVGEFENRSPSHAAPPPSPSEDGGLHRNRRRAATEGEQRLSRQLRAGRTSSLPPVQGEEEQQAVPDKPPDELEGLYRRLEAAHLSPMGRSGPTDFRASFIKRSNDDRVNEKLHRLRILNSTLKSKQLELEAVEQVLTDPPVTAPTYREWRLSHPALLEQVTRCGQAAGGAEAPDSQL